MMERSAGKRNKTALIFIAIALVSLLGGALFGSIGSIQFLYPEFLSAVPFFKIRPLHVSLVVSWIFFSAVGGIYFYMPNFKKLEWRSKLFKQLHLSLFVLTGVIILACYFAGKFGGREYWEFPPILAIPIIVSWIIFGINFFRTAFSKTFTWPVYMWMWGTGIVFFLFTFLESYLWIFPYFRDNHVRDITMQWKSYGALTGSWNMLVYGTALFLMEQIKKDNSVAHGRLPFLMYFLGFINLLFGWAHHTYTVPMAPWIRYLAYGISMTELLILAKIIISWRASLTSFQKDKHILSFWFIIASDVWIFINLVLAILISVPAINLFTHGTHITVAHAMGSTIGINTMILLASCIFILQSTGDRYISGIKSIKAGFWILNLFFFVFWIALIIAGSIKGYMMILNKESFFDAMNSARPYLVLFAMAGVGLLTGLSMIVLPLVWTAIGALTKTKSSEQLIIHIETIQTKEHTVQTVDMKLIQDENRNNFF